MAKDNYTMGHVCHDGSTVNYFIKNGVQWVSQLFPSGIKVFAEYENGKWMSLEDFNSLK